MPGTVPQVAVRVGPTTTTTTTVADDPGALLEGLRRLMRLAEGAAGSEEIFRALARELFLLLGADEVHVHHLAPPSWGQRAVEGGGRVAEASERVVVHLCGGEGRIAYTNPRSERPPGVAWVASTGQSVFVAGARELAGTVPRLAATAASSALLLGLTVRGEVEAVLVLARRDPESLDAGAVERARALVDQAANALALVRARAEAGTDAVTGCLNHRAMLRRLREEIDRAARTDGRLACMLLDLDDFKLVNDRHGHPAGDALLREVARALQGEFRAFDRVARYGGDEFVVILPSAALRSAAQAGARALGRLAALPAYGLEPGVHASVGVAQWRPGMTAEQLLAACDEALLRSKRAGKGRVELAGSAL
jgi:diguanylate cyclase (GGDEF)-like protein